MVAGEGRGVEALVPHPGIPFVACGGMRETRHGNGLRPCRPPREYTQSEHNRFTPIRAAGVLSFGITPTPYGNQMSLKRLRVLTAARREWLPFVASLEDYDILIAIGAAEEEGAPLGFKQLRLLDLAPQSTLQRRLKRLLVQQVIKTMTLSGDGRRMVYSLTAKTRVAYKHFLAQALDRQ